jgi:hypothetical protein
VPFLDCPALPPELPGSGKCKEIIENQKELSRKDAESPRLQSEQGVLISGSLRLRVRLL